MIAGMMIRLSICVLILSLSCDLKAQGQHETLGELDWILGTWIRENSRPGR